LLTFMYILPITALLYVILQMSLLFYSIFTFKSYPKKSNLYKKSFNLKKEKSEKQESNILGSFYMSVTVVIMAISESPITGVVGITVKLFTIYLTTLTILALLQLFRVFAYKSQQKISQRSVLRSNFFIMVMLLFSVFAAIINVSQILVIIFLFGAFYSFFKDFVLLLFTHESDPGYLTSIVYGSSMSPALMNEDIVLALTNMDDDDIETGDIIIYDSSMNYNSSTPIIHRVQNINDTAVTCKGDNAIISEPIHYANILGIVIAVMRDSNKFILNSKYNKYRDLIEKFYSGELSFKSAVKYPLIGENKIIISMVLAIICAIIISFI